MKIILSSAKTMREDPSPACTDLPVFADEAEHLLAKLRALTPQQRKKFWGCSDKLAAANDEILFQTDLRKDLTPAYACFEGTVFRHADFRSLSGTAKEYMQEHVRILSGLYGILKPYDGIRSYRLEMGSSFSDGSMYAYWQDRICAQLHGEIIVDLASKEYAQAVSRYLREGDRYITVTFKQMKNGRPVVQATASKAARGDMARWICERGITDPEELKEFRNGYTYEESLSSADEFVFMKGQL
ncbi:MAG: YaaA family protein [Solobacterium sp.]|nr:YaaA family protein [Solobacterium sp.]